MVTATKKQKVAPIIACQAVAVFAAFSETILKTIHNDELNMVRDLMVPKPYLHYLKRQ
jgi:hypothetical protein